MPIKDYLTRHKPGDLYTMDGQPGLAHRVLPAAAQQARR